MKLSKKNGLNPTIPLCPYCWQPKQQIILTGAAGDKQAKKMGRKDGDMPMYVQVENDIEPCDKCKEIGVGVVEMTDDTNEPTGNRWLMKTEAVERLISNEKLLKQVLDKRVMCIHQSVAKQLFGDNYDKPGSLQRKETD